MKSGKKISMTVPVTGGRADPRTDGLEAHDTISSTGASHGSACLKCCCLPYSDASTPVYTATLRIRSSFAEQNKNCKTRRVPPLLAF